MILGDLLSAFPHGQFHTLPGLLDSWAALPNSNPNACMPMQGGSLYHFYDGLWYDPAERRTHDLPCERRTRYRLSQPDTVKVLAQNKYKNTLIGVLRTQITFVTHSSPSCYVTLRTQVIRLNSGDLSPPKTDSGVFIIIFSKDHSLFNTKITLLFIVQSIVPSQYTLCLD